MSAPETLDAKELAQTNESLREQQRAVSNVLRAVARSQGLQPVLDEIVESATLLCAGDNGRLWLVKDGLLLAAAQYGSPPETYEYDVEHPHSVDRSSLAGRVALTQVPVHIPDILADPEYTYPGPRPYRAMLGVPVLIENDLLGVVAVVRIPPEPFAKEHIELVRTFADQAAIAIANARLIDAVERQRTELSRFVSPQVAELLSNEQGEQLLAGHRAYISCLFCDLRGFTAFAETAAPEELLELLREYHRRGSISSPIPGGSAAPTSGWGSASPPATRRSVGSALKAATTTARSGPSRTSRPGSAPTRSRERF